MVALIFALYLWLFWYAYIVVMGLYRAHLAGRLKGAALVLGGPAILVGLLMDVAANALLSFVFLDPPREWLLTTRFKRYIRSRAGWRADVAQWVCDNLLDVFDPTGEHC